MEFILEANEKNKLAAMHVTHAGQSVTFNISSRYGKAPPLTNLAAVMQPVNDYLSRSHPDDQAAIFDIYSQISTLSAPGASTMGHELLADLEKLIRQLFGIINLDYLFEWANVYSKFHIPPVLSESVGVYHSDTTYTVEEYRGLMGLTIVAKLMLPIWGQFLDTLTPTIGRTRREYRAAWMLRFCGLFDSPAWQRLTRYIQNIRGLKEDNFTMPTAMVLHGFVEEELPEFLARLTIVRKLAIAETTVAEIQKEQGKAQNNLVGSINSYIDGLLRNKTLSNDFGGEVRELAHPKEMAGGDENNTSISENYAAKQRVSDMYGVCFNVYCEDGREEELMAIISPDQPFDKELFWLFKAHLQSIELDLTDGKYLIMATVLTSKVLGVEGIDSLNYQSIINVLALSCVYLHQRKLYDIVKYLCARRRPMDITLMSGEQRQAQDAKFADETVKMLMVHYPYSLGASGDTILSWITDFVREEICDAFWEEQSPAYPCEQVTYSRNTPWYAHRDFKNLMAYLFIYTNRRLEANT